jgi:hypothetical protein
MKDLLKSKKFKTAVIGGLCVLVIKVAALKGIVLDEATGKALSEMVFGLASAYILAQGAADFGKEGKAQELLAGAVAAASTATITQGSPTEVVSADAPAEAEPEAKDEEKPAEDKPADSE